MILIFTLTPQPWQHPVIVIKGVTFTELQVENCCHELYLHLYLLYMVFVSVITGICICYTYYLYLQFLLEFIYLGSVSVPKDRLKAFVEAGVLLKIQV